MLRHNWSDKIAADFATNYIRGISLWLNSMPYSLNPWFQDTYMLQKYGQINTTLGRIRRRYVRKAVPEGRCFLSMDQTRFSKSWTVRWSSPFPASCGGSSYSPSEHNICWSGVCSNAISIHLAHNWDPGLLPHFKETRNSTTIRRAYHWKYCEGKFPYSIRSPWILTCWRSVGLITVKWLAYRRDQSWVLSCVPSFMEIWRKAFRGLRMMMKVYVYSLYWQPLCLSGIGSPSNDRWLPVHNDQPTTGEGLPKFDEKRCVLSTCDTLTRSWLQK